VDTLDFVAPDSSTGLPHMLALQRQTKNPSLSAGVLTLVSVKSTIPGYRQPASAVAVVGPI
jgi:hypothetical protein